MSKSITSITIEGKLLNEWRTSNPNKPLSQFIEESLKRELNENISIEDLEKKIKESYQNYLYLTDKLNEAIDREEQNIDMKNESDKKEIFRIKEEKKARLDKLEDLSKNIPEIQELKEKVKTHSNILMDTKYLIEFVSNIRSKYPDTKIGIVQLRDVLSAKS